MGFLSSFNILLIWIVLSEIIFSSVSCHNVSNIRVDINRYFLQIDNVFDYKTEEVIQNSPNDDFYNTVGIDWIIQPLDHFNPMGQDIFWQKYFYINSTSCPEGSSKCPVCVFIGGDAAIHPWWLKHTVLADQCLNQLNGTVFLLEHRFYGDSAPINSSTVRTLRYLTVSQALEDVSNFIMFIKAMHNLERRKVFVFGASYGGTLAALFRSKYPHLAFAAVALSAPMIREYQDKEYLPSIWKKIKNTSMTCYKTIDIGLHLTLRFMESYICSRQDYPLCQTLQDNLGLCTSIRNMTSQERRVFSSTFTKDFSFLAENDGVLNITLKDMCKIFSHLEELSPIEKVLAGDATISQGVFRSKTRAELARGGQCLQAKKQVICDYLMHDNDEHEIVTSGKRQRLWQKCTELGNFRTSSGGSKQHQFRVSDIPPNFHQDFCECAFGKRFSKNYTLDGIHKFHKTFGTFSPPYLETGGSRIIYTVGENDPALQRELRALRGLGTKVRTVNDNITYKIIGSAHCGEVFFKPTEFSSEMRLKSKQRLRGQHVSVVQQRIVNQLSEWIRT